MPRADSAYLRQHIAEVRESDNLDEITGICPRAYLWSYAANYLAQAAGAERFEAQLGRFGFNRSRGDAVIVTTKLTTPICVQ